MPWREWAHQSFVVAYLSSLGRFLTIFQITQLGSSPNHVRLWEGNYRPEQRANVVEGDTEGGNGLFVRVGA